MMTKLLIALITIASPILSAQTFQYTNNESGGNNIRLGYEIPIPVDSLTPIDGFRTYDSLSLRHQQLVQSSVNFNQIEVGSTFNQRTIWAYQIGDSDNLTVSGALEGAALINAGIHAREWQSPESATGLMERLYNNENDQYIHQYVLENINLMTIPVLNIDGFLQTQRFPTTVTESAVSPRDGRMRRKNMRNVDQSLTTTFDNLNGIDLNRNNNPYWATNLERSSGDVTSIVHHGGSAASEPETQALQQAAVLSGEDRLRFYIDTHSFSQIYFTPFTNNSRRNSLTEKLASTMRGANDFKYQYGPSASGGGIGATDEYFANTYQIPAYTLEIEPQNSSQQYGGFGFSHDGFILPNSEVARMREETSWAGTVGLYMMAEIPVLMAIEIWDSDIQNLVFAAEFNTSAGSRNLVITEPGELNADSTYQLKLIFNKPMRLIENDQVVGFSNKSDALDIDLQLTGKSAGQDSNWEIDASAGEWLVTDGYSRYKTDTFMAPMVLPTDFDWGSLSLLAIEISTHDMTGQNLDSDPSTIVDWNNGAWQNYEDSQGISNSDTGGSSKAMRLINDGSALFDTVTPEPTPTPEPPVTGGSSGGGGIHFLLLGTMFIVMYQRYRLAVKHPIV